MRSILLLRRNALLSLLLLIFINQAAFTQTTKTVSGTVVNSTTGEPVAGASVRVKGTKSIGGTTGATGEFKISVPASATTLVISSVGFTEMEAPADNTGHIKLVATDATLNDVVVVGYGTQKKATLTGAISVVGGKTMENRGPVANPLAALQGQAPGVIVTRTSGQPGRENWNFQIRGVSSINPSDPLIVLDGVPLQDNGELNTLNPADIDNISFLKDASSAIYGSRAANGVVLITTKKAKGNKFTVQYDGSVSRKLTALMPKLLNIRQWGQGLMQAKVNDYYGVTPPATDQWYEIGYFAANPPDSGYIDITKLPGYVNTANNLYYNGLLMPAFGDVKDFTFFDVNMQKLLWGNATSTQHNLSFSGRNEKSGYRVSIGYMNDGSQLQWGLNGTQRYNLRLNHDYTFSKKAKLETNISLEQQDIQQPSMLGNGGYSALSNYSQPGIPAFSKNGAPYEWGTVYSAPGQLSLGGDNKEYNRRAILNTSFIYNIVNHLTFTGTAGYNQYVQDTRVQQKQIQYYNYAGTIAMNTFPTAGTLGGNGTYYSRSSINDPFYSVIGRMDYRNTFGGVHDVTVMVGTSYEREEYNKFSTTTYDMGNDNTPSLGLGILSSTAGYVTNSEGQTHTALGAYFGRATYGYKNKYLLEVLGRYDGTSKFIEQYRWKPFYGASAAWRVTEESFMKGQTILNELKIRASYGVTGNQAGKQITNYDYMQLLGASAGGPLIGSTTSVTTFTTGTLVSLQRTWEKIKNENIGIDFALLHSRLSGTFEVYQKENTNMLLPRAYPAVLGAPAPYINVGDLKAWGWEGMLSWHDNIGKDFSYNVAVTMTDNQNKLVNYGGTNLINGGYNFAVEGYSLNSIFGLKYAGRIQDQKTLDAYNAAYAPTGSTNNIGLPVPFALTSPAGQMSGLRPGDNMFKDVNGDGKLSVGSSTTNPGDLVYLGRDDPRYSYGVNLGFQWKGIDFLTMFQGVGKRTIFRTSNWRVPYATIFQGQSTAWWDNTWTASNTNAYFPNLHSNTNQGAAINGYNYQPSSWSVENGAYLRLKNLVIGYTIPQSLIRNIKAIQKLRFYFSGSDLWEITHIHDGWDPEDTRTVSAGSNERYPFYRYLTFGANVTF